MQYLNNIFHTFAIIGTRLYIEFITLSGNYQEFNRNVRLCFFHVTEKWAKVKKKNIDYVKYIVFLQMQSRQYILKSL